MRTTLPTPLVAASLARASVCAPMTMAVGFGAGLRGEDVGCGDGFKTDAAEAAVAIFKNYVDAAHMTRTSNLEFFNESGRGFFGGAGDDLRGFLLLRERDFLEQRRGCGGGAEIGCAELLQVPWSLPS